MSHLIQSRFNYWTILYHFLIVKKKCDKVWSNNYIPIIIVYFFYTPENRHDLCKKIKTFNHAYFLLWKPVFTESEKQGLFFFFFFFPKYNRNFNLNSHIRIFWKSRRSNPHPHREGFFGEMITTGSNTQVAEKQGLRQ